MKDDTKVVATSNATELVNATEVASIEQSNTNIMEKKEISENGNAANAASNELKVGSINSIFYFLHKAAEPFNCLEQDNLA